MRIVSLLPSATEIVYALGLEDELVGVTHECDWPPAARTKPVVSWSSLPAEATPGQIDRLVSASVDADEPIYRLDADAIRRLRPDVVLSQDLRAVCAVPSGHVNAALDVLGCQAQVVSLDPSSLDEVLDGLRVVGRVTGVLDRAEETVAELRRRLEAVRRAVAGRDRLRLLALEWGDPPFTGGHWVPDMIECAGGQAVLGSRRSPSVRMTWSEVASAEADLVVFMPCGYELGAAVGEATNLAERDEFDRVPAIYAVDASAYFSRPGPRIVTGVEILASAMHSSAVPAPPDGAIARIR